MIYLPEGLVEREGHASKEREIDSSFCNKLGGFANGKTGMHSKAWNQACEMSAKRNMWVGKV